MNTDIVLLLYNRPHHSRAVLDSLVANDVSQVQVFMDLATDPANIALQNQLVEEIGARQDIEVRLVRHPKRLGLAASVRAALDTTLARADAVILLEDDCIVRPNGIRFFEEGLRQLRDDRRVRSLCGYLYPCPFAHHNGEPLMLRRFSSWGWATWRDRWVNRETDLATLVATLTRDGRSVDDVASDLAALCRSPKYLENRVDVWSVAWALEHFVTDTFAVYPSTSVIDNIGFDGSGQHCVSSTVFAPAPGRPPQAWDWRQLAHNPHNDLMLKHFMDQHGPTIYPRP